MFYLVTQAQEGYKLVDLAMKVGDLTPRIQSLLNENAAAFPAIYDEKAMRAAFLVDGFGVVAEEAGFLISLDDL